MPELSKEKIKLVVADIPWGKTANAWDQKFDTRAFLNQLSGFYRRQPIGILLMCSLEQAVIALMSMCVPYRYDLIYEKARPGGYLDANRRPLRAHETIYVFGKGVYNSQRFPGPKYRHSLQKANSNHHAVVRKKTEYDGHRYPRSVQKFAMQDKTRRHPTQKPIPLVNWLCQSYSNLGDLILDPVAGSFSTAVGAISNGRNAISIEKNGNFFDCGVDRLLRHIRDNNIDATVEVRR